MLRRMFRFMLAATLATAFASTALAAHWDMATPYPDANFHTKNIYQFVDQIEQASDLEITVHSAGSLLKHPQIKRALQTGQIQAGEGFISILGNENPIFSEDSIPFLATSYERASKLWEASRDSIGDLLGEDGIKLLYAVPWPPQSLYVSKPIDSVDDLKGLKCRAYNSLTSRLAELLGMVPTQVEVPEVPQAFSTGIIDAMITSPTTGVNTKAWDYVDYFYTIRAWVPKNMVLVNQEAFDALPDETQALILDAAEGAGQRGPEMSREEAEGQSQARREHGLEGRGPSGGVRSGRAGGGNPRGD